MHLSQHPALEKMIAVLLVFAAVTAAVAMAVAELPAGQSRQPAESIDRQIQRLVEELGHEDYFVRRRAQEELASLSFGAFDAISAATTHDDLEIVSRARYLLRLMRVQWTTEDDPPEVKSLLKNYHRLQDQAKKLSAMESLARLPDFKGIPALCRLVRFEESLLLSKRAAIELLHLAEPGEPSAKELAELFSQNLVGSRRASAEWLLTWIRFTEAPQPTVADWAKLVEAEHALLTRSPTETSPDVVARLIRLQIKGLKSCGLDEQITPALQRLIGLERGDPATLAELLQWLIEEQAWSMVDELSARFASQFAANAPLLYLVAAARAEQGDQQGAEQRVEQALRLNPGRSSTRLTEHYVMAGVLKDRGRFEWARREYRHVIESSPPGGIFGVSAQRLLAEMFHDQGREFEAFEESAELANTLQEHPNPQTFSRITLAEVRSRMNYFHACHWRDRSDPAKQRECLDKALLANAADLDTLIACYRLPDRGHAGPTPEYRARIRRLVKSAVADLRQQIAADPTSAGPYNQFAWLVGNTEGDFDEALKYSQKSIELSPGYGGYYDTLAHVYFAKGDYANAVKTQTKAAELEPHSGLIARKLEVFRKKSQE